MSATPAVDCREIAAHWNLDPAVAHLNHGSFGACPRPVLAQQDALRARLEAEPTGFISHELEGLYDAARARLAAFLGATPEDLAFVPNATHGVNTVLRALRLAPGDGLLLTDHAYNAVGNAARYVAEREGLELVVARVPFPLADPGEAVDAVLAAVTPRTRLAILDHVTSPTALRLPLEQLVPALAAGGIDTLVDGAHAPGMLPLDLDALGAAYYTGNCHKWLCAPKGAAFLHVRRDRQAGIRPLAISHGANSPRTDRSRFELEFGWSGTVDPTPWLCIPAALDFLGGLLPGGWPALLERNHAASVALRARLCALLGVPPPCPDGMLGSLFALPLPAGIEPLPGPVPDPLRDHLFDRFGVRAVVSSWPAPPSRWLRVSTHVYNGAADFARLADALRELQTAAEA
ncbi:MAG TPA: aminotransferase class V-fold PLP-dependent enzyme [Gammaproteobacteria bacterium]